MPPPAMRCSPVREIRGDNRRRGCSLEGGILLREKNDDLALFNEMETRERDNSLLQSNDDFEDTFSMKLRYLLDYRLGMNHKTRKEDKEPMMMKLLLMLIYDLAALKYWGLETILNFPLPTYQKQLIEMEGISRDEFIGSRRRKSSGFSRGVSKHRGVARHRHNGRWEARIGRVFVNKYLYLGTYDVVSSLVTPRMEASEHAKLLGIF